MHSTLHHHVPQKLDASNIAFPFSSMSQHYEYQFIYTLHNHGTVFFMSVFFSIVTYSVFYYRTQRYFNIFYTNRLIEETTNDI